MFLEKSSYFNRNHRLIRLFYFKKYRNFIESGVVQFQPNRYIRLPVMFGMKCKKYGPPNVPRKKVRISIGNIDLFAYSILKNIEILTNQGFFKVNQIDIPDYR